MGIESSGINSNPDPKEVYKKKQSYGRATARMADENNPNRVAWLRRMRELQEQKHGSEPESNLH